MKRFLIICLSLGCAASALAQFGGTLVPPSGGGGSGDMLGANNLSDVASAATSRTNLGATTVGANIFSLTNPGAISFLKIAANNTVTTRTPAQVLSDIGAIDGTALNATNLSSGTVPDARFPATLPAASGLNLTALNATNLGSGTVPDARFPATLPAASGVNLTALNATNLGSGTVPDARFPATLPATAGTNLTGTAASLTAGNVSNVAVATTHATDDTVIPTNKGGWTEYFVTGSDFTTTNLTATDITGLVTGTLSASARYEFEANLIFLNAADTTGMKWALHGGGTGTAATVNAIAIANITNVNSVSTIALSAIDTLTPAVVTYSGAQGIVFIKGFFTTNSTGTITASLQVAKVTSNTATVRVGSVFRVRKAHT